MQSADKFKQLQQEMGVTNSALSRLLGVSLATIEKRRSGKVGICDEVLLAMRFLLNNDNQKNT